MIEYGLDGSLCNPVEFVDVWRAGGLRNELFIQELSELPGDELASIVAVDGLYRDGSAA